MAGAYPFCRIRISVESLRPCVFSGCPSVPAGKKDHALNNREVHAILFNRAAIDCAVQRSD